MNLHKVKVNNLILPSNVILAPLAGYTNSSFRELCYNLGASLTYTEMVSAKGLKYNNEKTKTLLYVPESYSGIKACQIFGSDPDIMGGVASGEELAPFEIIDINMGCPMPKITGNGEGSALLNNLPLAEKIISAVKKSGKTVSVKFRTGWESSHKITSEFAKMCEGAGADMITVHGRTRDKIYGGEVDFAEIAKAKACVKIPVFANGGVFTKEDAEKLLSETGADGVCIARGAMYSPWIFAEITGKPYSKKQVLLTLLNETFKTYGERFALVYMRKMTVFALKGVAGSCELKVKIFSCRSCCELKEIIENLNI